MKYLSCSLTTRAHRLLLLLYIESHLVQLLQKTFGIPALVKELRASDDDGAPFLFQAAASNNIACLKRVQEILEETLGWAGLVEQLESTDNDCRTIVMHAVKCEKPEVFSAVRRLLTSPDAPERDSKPIRHYLEVRDIRGMSLLHMGARYANEMILKEVLKAYRCENLFERFFREEDSKGRTPLMHLFRNRARSTFEELTKKLKILAEEGAEDVQEQLTHIGRTPVRAEFGAHPLLEHACEFQVTHNATENQPYFVSCIALIDSTREAVKYLKPLMRTVDLIPTGDQGRILVVDEVDRIREQYGAFST